MNVICRCFGHRASHPDHGAYYGRPVFTGAVDNLGRAHGHVLGSCIRCDALFEVAKLHLNHEEILRAVAAGAPRLKEIEERRRTSTRRQRQGGW